jgi:hypothetical protein
MKKLATVLLFFTATAAYAGVRNCTTTLVTANVCAASTDQLLYYSVSPAIGTRLVDAIAVAEHYDAVVACASGVPGCTEPNPETKTQFADRIIKSRLKAYMESALDAAGEAAKAAAIAADPVPVIP